MASFFEGLELPPAPPAPTEHRQPPWHGMAENVVPVTVALDVLLARTADWAAWIGSASVTPDGFAFGLSVRARQEAVEPDRMHPLHHQGGPDALRFGVGFADGRRAVVDGPPARGDASREIALVQRGGHGGLRSWSQTFWLWPLPPEGPVRFALVWPAKGLQEVVAEVDSAPLREAAERALELWPDDRPLPSGGLGGWTAYGA
ncbi:MAG TPA: hypothetical protein VFG42_16085 [Baekduia sp.]|uniref:hypothetical protein n=1 Tax=Baekduia sp. TaxID=2600305 RepID=UPI002D79DF40|nr:hypothetical protein [Baekduia sp.]HET6508313.1 hypothetical protein [Baekduia sp.]